MMQDTADKERLPFYLRPAFLAALVAMLTVLKLWSATNTHFVEDEAYYRLWGLAPALGYFDHPPMIGWWIWIGQTLFGDTILGTRVLVVLSSVLGSLAVWRTGCLLFDRRVAGWAVLFLNASILGGVGGILATPDSPSVLFWLLSLWALAELQTSRNANWWLAVGVFAGLGLLSKYSVLFLGAGILLWLVWVPDARRWFGTWQLWVGGAIAVLLFCPVLYWNHLHEWASFHKQFGRVGRGDWTTRYIFEFLGGLVGLFNPLVAVSAAVGGYQLAKRTWKREPAASLLILMVLPFLTFLLFHSLQSRVQANWPAPLFPAFALMAAVFVGGVTRGAVFWRNWSLAGVGLGLAVAIIVHIHAVNPLTGDFARRDPTFQLRGWPEIGQEVRRLAQDTGADYIATTGYGLNGQLAFLLKDELPVVQLNERIRYVMLPDPDPALFEKTGLYITEERRDRSQALVEEFATIRRIATIPRTVRGTLLENLIVYEVSEPIDGPLGYEDD